MVKRIASFCDHPHVAQIGEHAGETRTYGINGNWLVAEHCDIADKYMQEAFAAFMEYAREYKKFEAVPVPQKKTAQVRPAIEGTKHPYDHPCLFCVTITTRSGVGSHLLDKHGLKGLQNAYGLTCPLCLETVEMKLASHAKNAHGIANVLMLFQAAKEAGDPHGIVAMRIAQLNPVKAIGQ